MKAIYSIWTPLRNRGSLAGLCHRFRTPGAHMRMLALTMAHSLRWFGRVELWADRWSASFLDGLVPGVRTIVAFDDLDGLPPCLWSLAKMSAQVAQDGPFIHIDNDALFVTDPTPLLRDWEVGFQSLDFAVFSAYSDAENDLLARGMPVPGRFRVRPGDRIYNCGIVVDRAGVLREPTAAIVDFARRHADQFERAKPFTTFLMEQGWQSAALRGRRVQVLLRNPWDQDEARAAGFVHLLDAWKRDPGYEAKVAARLERDFPAINNRIRQAA